jgi:hypothetical protein
VAPAILVQGDIGVGNLHSIDGLEIPFKGRFGFDNFLKTRHQLYIRILYSIPKLRIDVG